MAAERTVYIYAAALRPGEPGELVGVGNHPVELLHHSDLAIVLSDVRADDLSPATAESADPRLLGELAQRHDAVIRSIGDVSASVLPFRLGIVLADRDAARRFVDSRADTLLSALTRVAGRDEWGITIRCPGATTRSAMAADVGRERVTMAGTGVRTGSGGGGGNGSGTAYLRRRREQLGAAQQRQQSMARVADDVDARLRAVADDVTGSPADGDVVLSRSYLVPRSLEARFVAEADACGDRLRDSGCALRVSGPWPAYSFVSAEVRVGSDD